MLLLAAALLLAGNYDELAKRARAAAEAKAAEEAKRRSQIITHLKDEIKKKEEIIYV